MDSIIENFITVWTQELQNNIKKSFNLMGLFDYQNNDYGLDFINLISSSENLDNETVGDTFIIVLTTKINELLLKHGLVLDATLDQKNEILQSIYDFQNLEDYEHVECLLESLESDEYIISEILAEYCSMDTTTINSLIINLNDGILDMYKQFVKSKKKETVSYNPLKKNINNFFKCFGSENIGYIMYTNNIELGADFDVYKTCIQEHSYDAVEDIALNIFSVMILTKEKDYISLYRKHSEELIHDLETMDKVETSLLNLISKFNDFNKYKIKS